eukprot:Gb_24820 [translate_table: standard]
MSKSKASQPRSLSVPKPDFLSCTTLKNGFPSSVSVETSPLKPESPVDLAMLERASSLARFGIDIGGTLCKVVFFEPARESCSFNVNLDDRSNNAESMKLHENVYTKIGEVTTSVLDKLSEDVHSELSLGKEEKPERKIDDSGVEPAAKREIQSDGHSEIKVGPGMLHDPPRNLEYLHSNVEDGRHRKSSQECIDHIKISLDTLTGERQKEGINSSKYITRHLRKIWLSSHAPVNLPGRGTLHFKCFETWRMDEFLKLTKEHSLVSQSRAIGATGGGAHKFFQRFLEIAGLQLQHSDELKSLVRGIDFLVQNAQHENFEYPIGSYKAGRIQRPWRSPENSSDDDDNDSLREKGSNHVDNPADFPLTKTTEDNMNIHSKEDAIGKCESGKKIRTMAVPCSPIIESDRSGVLLDGNQSFYPYLVVNIGSGVSILRVDSPDKFERVGGTSLGGSTFLGLASALTGCNSSFEEAVSLAIRGDSTQIDMLVGDIYGGDYKEMGLAATTVASSFGKLVEPGKRDVAMQTPEHLAKAVLLMITNNIGSIAMLHARATGVDHVLFTGSFLHGNKVGMRLLAVAMEFWSKGLIKAIFLRHEGHAGAVGAMLCALDSTSQVDAFLLK